MSEEQNSDPQSEENQQQMSDALANLRSFSEIKNLENE